MPEFFEELCFRLAGRLQALPDKPEETVVSTARALYLLASGRSVSAVAAMTAELPVLTVAQQEAARVLIDRRLDGVPLAHLTGRVHFMGLELLAGGEALVPRLETEILAQAAVAAAQDIAGRAPLVIDVCTGSGNVALALAAQVPGARVFAADLSAEAVALAQRNAAHLGLAARVEFCCGDLLAPFDAPEFAGQCDVLTCNPPYISSARVEQMPAEIAGHEPRLAFDGGPFGVAIMMRLLQEAPRLLRTGGWLGFEVGLGQGPGMLKRLAATGYYDDARLLTDATGASRAIAARYAGRLAN